VTQSTRTEQPTTRQFRRQALTMTTLAMIVVYILWNVPTFNVVMYPMRLFVTYAHEAGHALMALLTGGSIVGFTVSPDGSGLARTIGGNRALILPAGYIGAALLGSLLFFVANRFPRYINQIAFVLGGAMIAFTVLFARPDESGSLIALTIGIGFGLLLLFLGWKAGRLLTLLVINVLGVMTALNGVLDLWFLMQNTDASRGTVMNDAAAFTRDVAPLIPASVIAFMWALIAIAIFGMSVWYGVWKPLSNEINDAVEQLSGKSNA